MAHLFKIPRGTGIKPHFLVMLILVVVILLLLMVFFLYHYGPIQLQPVPEVDEPVDRSTVENVIQQLKHQPPIKASVLPSKTIPQATKQTQHRSNPKLNTNPILIYHQDLSHFKKHNNQDTSTQGLSSPYTIKTGNLIPAILMTGIQSDLPGTIIAKVSSHVFDTVTGDYLLIPQGSTLIGSYDTHLALNQSRLFVFWSKLIFPNGTTLNLKAEPGVDLKGLSGLKDLVDHHYLKIFGSGLLFSALSAAGQMSQPQSKSDNLTPQQMIAASIGQQVSQTSSQWMDKQMGLQPTLTIRPGTLMNVLVTHDLVFGGPYEFQLDDKKF